MTTSRLWTKGAARRLLALGAAALLTLALSLHTAPISVSAATKAELDKKMDQLQQKEKELRAELNSTNNSLSDSKKRKATMEKQVENTKEQIELLASQINELDKKLTGKNTEIAGKEQEIANKEAAIRTTSDQLSERMRALSKKGTLSSVQMVFSTKEYAEYLVKSKMMERIAENDQKALDQLESELTAIKTAKAALETDKQDIAEQKKKVEALKAQSDTKKRELDNLYKAIQSEIKKIQSTASDYAAQLEKNQKEQDKIDKEITALIHTQSTNTGKYGAGLMEWPVPTVRNISSGFGSRWGTTHRGIDIANGSIPIYGQKIVAAADGVVIYSNYTSKYGGGYGYYCIVDHGLNAKGVRISTLYAHTSKMYARVGDKVQAGKTVLALAGDTGNVTGPHLHFEVRENGVAVDPIKKGYVSVNK